MTIFLSYAHEDLASVEALTRDLEELADAVWYDKSITGGQEWWDEILHQIRDCRLFVLAVSRVSLRSEACFAEWTYAGAVGRPLLTVRVDGVDMVSAPAELKRHQYVDYLVDDADSIRKLAKALRFVPEETPLPAALPPEPDLPLSYRDRFAALYAKDLTVPAQVEAVALLKLDIDNDFNTAQATKLLVLLRDRFDTSWKVREDIDRYLAGRQPAPVVAQPRPQQMMQETASTPQQPLPNAAWYADPTKRFELRYWDGTRWTEHVGHAGVVSTDPFPN